MMGKRRVSYKEIACKLYKGWALTKEEDEHMDEMTYRMPEKPTFPRKKMSSASRHIMRGR